MQGSAILDVILVILLVSSLVAGYRSGLIGSISGILGLVAGAVAAYFVVPLVPTWVSAVEWRTPASIASALVLVIVGLTVGEAIGLALRRRTPRKLRGVDRLFGAVIGVAAAAAVMSMVAFSVGALGIPVLTSAIASSGVVRTIDSVTPDPVKSFLAQLRSTVVDDGLPRITDAFGGQSPTLPQAQLDNAALDTAAQSVLRITGNAVACGQSQSGSGFVVAPERVLTNAHVVAGVTEAVVEVPGAGALTGEIVYFDPVDDLALISVPGLTAAPLTLQGDLPVDAEAVSLGYPFGGPFDSDPARVISVASVLVADIYGQSPTERSVYTLAADVQQGESGGPLLSDGGQVAGVIFAKAANTANVGYALAMDEVTPVVDQAGSLSAAVSSGACIQG
ncbi:MarP family serine protease [Cryobacterium sp. PAMC25264]|uniref:MarP family serine protease n=1 Tax=Cryobacterium sp. PAMC25264 TaxID=2861288 RepID=UPI001C632ADE|nr:MarP family serine protease [Cryobacterium sp. PAMC25264]QYF72210.1 MarP family serine protease [Cryobacterium sp. PAMC25264]